MLKPVIYNRDGNYLSYGLKFFPEPANSYMNDAQYKWLENFA